MNLARRIAQVLLEIGAVGFTPENPITFKSGIKSPVYMDNRSLPFYPEQWREIILGFQELIEQNALQFDVIAGIEAAGIPHSAALGYAMQKPSIFVRKMAKEHGKKKRVEGGDVSGLRVLLIEDLVTTGGSSLSGVAALKEDGAIVENCLAITSYGFPEAAQNFQEAGVHLHTLTTFDALWKIAKKQGMLKTEMIAMVEAWKKSPRDWTGV